MAIEYLRNPKEKTLGEFIENNYPGFKAWAGSAPLDTDISHGIAVDYWDQRHHGHGEGVKLMPYILWTDGSYNPCEFWGEEHYLYLSK